MILIYSIGAFLLLLSLISLLTLLLYKKIGRIKECEARVLMKTSTAEYQGRIVKYLLGGHCEYVITFEVQGHSLGLLAKKEMYEKINPEEHGRLSYQGSRLIEFLKEEGL